MQLKAACSITVTLQFAWSKVQEVELQKDYVVKWHLHKLIQYIYTQLITMSELAVLGNRMQIIRLHQTQGNLSP